ncbi:uncharacterized protein BDR25DRAFT_348078 [Lindgomyces ingoldianus]|uniref:Uncharacterized protein n=1 Tax=Lindgomyces ingoldianus TaxID=673940 RepID=A0ACB6RGA7_9PLEO|nr:uncharacterized protein BDR25DRAFT_348078 [Lindgomyces ingoldianus]KAF2477760.1 hypothetical protein BDR25DRAFT_348078 [Lindgomyces ingoldianus]
MKRKEVTMGWKAIYFLLSPNAEHGSIFIFINLPRIGYGTLAFAMETAALCLIIRPTWQRMALAPESVPSVSIEAYYVRTYSVSEPHCTFNDPLGTVRSADGITLLRTLYRDSRGVEGLQRVVGRQGVFRGPSPTILNCRLSIYAPCCFADLIYIVDCRSREPATPRQYTFRSERFIAVVPRQSQL